MENRFAVVVGVNDFGGDHSADLRGCVPDAQHVRARLLARGWPAGNIQYLTDGAATKLAVVVALRAMLCAARPDDHCVFFQSSHGTQVPDASGDEADHLDEALCYHGILDDWAGSILTDDEFGAILHCAPAGAVVTAILDACHSGTGTRALLLGGQGRARYHAPPGGLPEGKIVRRRFGRGWWGHARRKRSGSAVLVPDMDHRLIAACRDWQTSADADIGGPCGAFTHFLLAEEEAHAQEPAAVVVARAESALRAAQYEQRPTVEGPQRLLDLPFFA